MEGMAELIAIEQLLNSLPTSVRIWVSERKPTRVTEAGQLADDYVLARKRNTDSGKVHLIKDSERPASKRCGFCGRAGHVTKECRTAARAGSHGQGEGRHNQSSSSSSTGDVDQGTLAVISGGKRSPFQGTWDGRRRFDE